MNNTLCLLLETLDDLNNYKHTRSECLQMCIQNRLDKSLITYYNTIINSGEYLTANSSNVKTLRKINEDYVND